MGNPLVVPDGLMTSIFVPVICSPYCIVSAERSRKLLPMLEKVFSDFQVLLERHIVHRYFEEARISPVCPALEVCFG